MCLVSQPDYESIILEQLVMFIIGVVRSMLTFHKHVTFVNVFVLVVS